MSAEIAADSQTGATEPENSGEQRQRGTLKIFMGYAPGVGKTFSMLSEGIRRHKRGEDVVVGYAETYGREDVEKLLDDMEVIPKLVVEFNKVRQKEMDVDAILRRKPGTVLIDEVAHANAPGSRNKKRYEDIEELLLRGIHVITTMNVYHLESLNDVVTQITGDRPKDTIPDFILERADEIVVVDLTPEALQNRLKRGDVIGLDKVQDALKGFFRKGNLNALRELMLRETAEEVEEDLELYMKEEGIDDSWQTVERVMICVSPSTSARKLIRRGAKIARRHQCKWVVVTVQVTSVFARKPTLKDRQILYNHFKLARQLGAETVTLSGKSASETLAAFAREQRITQMIVGHANRPWWEKMLRGSTVTRLLTKLKQVEIHVIPSDN